MEVGGGGQLASRLGEKNHAPSSSEQVLYTTNLLHRRKRERTNGSWDQEKKKKMSGAIHWEDTFVSWGTHAVLQCRKYLFAGPGREKRKQQGGGKR